MSNIQALRLWTQNFAMKSTVRLVYNKKTYEAVFRIPIKQAGTMEYLGAVNHNYITDFPGYGMSSSA